MLAKIGLSLFKTWRSIIKYVCMGEYGLFTKFMGSFLFYVYDVINDVSNLISDPHMPWTGGPNIKLFNFILNLHPKLHPKLVPLPVTYFPSCYKYILRCN